MANQINSKLNANTNPMETSLTNGHASTLIGSTHQQSNESVDLDNLFAFLSEVTPTSTNNHTIIDDISEKMDSLVQDLDVELENVIQQEIDSLALDKPKMMGNKIGVPSLPEPTMPPPPPPVISNTNGNKMPKLPPLPPIPIKKPDKRKGDEPIYEAVIPREEICAVPEMPEVPPHHGIMEHKLR